MAAVNDIPDAGSFAKIVGALGIINVFYNQIGLGDLVDTILPKKSHHKVSNGDCLLSLLYNGFSGERRVLSKIDHQMSKLPINELFDRNIDPNDFNDDVLGRFFDNIYNYGPDAFFTRIVGHVNKMTQGMIEFDRLHSDITNFTVYGQYNKPTEDESFRITFGHPKDGRNHLRMFSLFLATNSKGIPVAMKELPGNCSDSKSLAANMRGLLNELKKNLEHLQDTIFIADAAFYNQFNIRDFGAPWITRVTETIGEAKELIAREVPLTTVSTDDRYSYFQTTSDYGETAQVWVLFHSTEMAARQEKTLKRKHEKAVKAGQAALRKKCNVKYVCGQDALNEANRWIKSQSLLKFSRLEVVARESVNGGKRGRPKKGEIRPKDYYIDADVILDDELAERERQTIGRFILATNNFDLSPEDILKFYKEQSQVEKGFRFLKSRDFRASEILLKNPHRIQGLCCFVAIMLLFYTLLEYKLNEGLKNNNIKINDETGRKLNKVTMGKVFDSYNDIKLMADYNTTKNTLTYYYVFFSEYEKQFLDILEALGPDFINFYLHKSGIIPLISVDWVPYSIKVKVKSA